MGEKAIRIQLLGRLAVEVDSQPARIVNSAKGIALLCFLLVKDGQQRREAVADMLWDASSTRQSLHRLRELLARVRREIPRLESTRTTLAFIPQPNDVIDIDQLKAAFAPGQAEERAIALQHYTGDLLPDFYLDNVPHFNEWLSAAREQLRRRVRTSYREVAAAYAAADQYADAIAVLRRWTDLAPTDEDATQQLMNHLALMGQTAAAQDAYQRLDAALAAELGLAPGAATQALARRIAQQSIAGDTMAEPTSPRIKPGSLPPTAIVPFHRNPHFVGREEPLRTLAATLLPNRSDRRAALVAGMAGLGKSQLAVEFAYRYGYHFPGGVFWLDFADPNAVAQSVAESGGERGLGLFRAANRMTLSDRIGRVQRAWQEAVPRLLIFDNCRDAALLQQWLPVTGGCRVLITSRHAQWPPLLNLYIISLKTLDRGESIRLLQRDAPQLDERVADGIAAELGDLPLALHLAGAFLRRYRTIGGDRFVAQLQAHNPLAHPSLLGHAAPLSPTGYAHGIERALALAWTQLQSAASEGGEARRIATVIACMAPATPIPQAFLIRTLFSSTDDLGRLLAVEDGLDRLRALGFISIDTTQSVVTHRLVVAFFRRVLLPRDALQEVREAIERELLRLLTAQWEDTAYLGDLPLAPTHVETIVDAAITQRTLRAAALADYFGRHLLDLGELRRAKRYLDHALAIRTAEEREPSFGTAALMSTMGTYFLAIEETEKARPFFERAVEICNHVLPLGDSRRAQAQANLAVILARLGDFETAERSYLAAIASHDEAATPNHNLSAAVRRNLALLYRRQGHYANAMQQLTAALALRREELGAEHPHTVKVVATIAGLARIRGDYDLALRLGEMALAQRVAHYGADHVITALMYTGVALVHLDRGADADALALLQRALAIRREKLTPDHPHIAITLSAMGQCYARLDQPDRAETCLRNALALQAPARPLNPDTASTLERLGALYTQCGRTREARPLLEQALSIRAHLHGEHHPVYAGTLLRHGEWLEATGATRAAATTYAVAIKALETAVLPTHVDLVHAQERLAALITDA